MKAIVQHRYGGPEVLALGEVDRPTAGDGEVLVRVRAASLFFGDWRVMRGSPFIVRFATGLRRPKHPVPGIDLAGVVEAMGPNVTSLKPGDAVFGWSTGTLAEYTCAGEEHFVPKPANLTFEEAASVPEAGMTALQGLRDHGRVQPGQQVMVIGASGGVGSFAIQIAKALGAEVTAVCSTRNIPLVRSIGADHVIDYTNEDILRSGRLYDVIYQGAGTASPTRLRRALTPTGTLVLSNGQGRFGGIDRLLKAGLMRPVVRQRMAIYVTTENHADLVALKELIDAGKIRPVIDRTYGLAESAAAFEYLEAGHTQGKIVITV